jgi:hypothetical protein
MINFPPLFRFVELRVDLYHRLALRGIKDVHITWNEDHLSKIDAIPTGPEKEAALDITADEFVKMFHDIETGAIKSYEINSDEDIERRFKEGTQKLDPIVEALINATTLEQEPIKHHLKICAPFPEMHVPWSPEKKTELKRALTNMHRKKKVAFNP